MKDHIVLDLESQYEFSEVGGRDFAHLLKVSLAGCYSYAEDRFFAFEEKEIPALEALLKNAGLVIGFNTKFFDYTVLQPYMKELDLKTLPSCDLMEEVTNVLGHRLSLDSIADATLGEKKSGHGLDAIRYYREGNMEALKKYCLDDVRLTRDVFEYGKKHGKILYTSKYRPDLLSASVDWSMYIFDSKSTAATTSSATLLAPAAPRANPQTGNYSLF